MTLENITDLDHKHAERVWKDFGIQNLGNYHYLYVSSDTLLLADVFKKFQNQNFRNIWTWSGSPALGTWFGMASMLEENCSTTRILTDNDMPLMIEKGIRAGMCHAIQRHAEVNNKYMKNYDPNK